MMQAGCCDDYLTLARCDKIGDCYQGYLQIVDITLLEHKTIIVLRLCVLCTNHRFWLNCTNPITKFWEMSSDD